MTLLEETRGALAQAKAELEAARKQINEVKLQANGVTSRGPFLTRTPSILRVGIAVVFGAFAGHIFTPYGWVVAVLIAGIAVRAARD